MRKKNSSNFIFAVVAYSLFIIYQFLDVSIATIISFVLGFLFIVGLGLLLYDYYQSNRVASSINAGQRREPVMGVPEKQGAVEAPEDDFALPVTYNKIRALEWSHFEKLCVAYYKEAGFGVKWQRIGADGGIDVTLFDGAEEGLRTHVVQCKAWSQKPVGVRYIRELLGSMHSVKAASATFITTSSYTQESIAFARSNYITLLTTKDLVERINSLPLASREVILKSVFVGDYWTPRCPNCGRKLHKKSASKGPNKGQLFWGCKGYPRCRYTMRMSSKERSDLVNGKGLPGNARSS